MTVEPRSVLVLNAGSSSIKASLDRGDALSRRVQVDLRRDGTTLTVFPQDGRVFTQRLPVCDGDPWQTALDALLNALSEDGQSPPTVVGHRIVHGGQFFAEPVVITPEVVQKLCALTPLAPLHQPHGLAGIQTISERYPATPQVACFDTAFHRTCPEVARRYALPREWHDRGIERYGFHGLSYQSIVEQLPEVAGTLPRRLVIAHLGAGASMAAVLDGKSIATTMGFTPLDGLVMATRCGSLDPGVVLHLAEAHGLSTGEIGTLLSKKSGLLGVSGISSDMQHLLECHDVTAEEAVELFCYRAVREVGSLAAALGGLDCLVFTAGIGEHAAAVRQRICEGLDWLGLAVDQAANKHHGPCVSTPESRCGAWILPTDEARVIAQETKKLYLSAIHPLRNEPEFPVRSESRQADTTS
jgi:acetate kinase